VLGDVLCSGVMEMTLDPQRCFPSPVKPEQLTSKIAAKESKIRSLIKNDSTFKIAGSYIHILFSAGIAMHVDEIDFQLSLEMFHSDTFRNTDRLPPYLPRQGHVSSPGQSFATFSVLIVPRPLNIDRSTM
jgi:hypothetical protein